MTTLSKIKEEKYQQQQHAIAGYWLNQLSSLGIVIIQNERKKNLIINQKNLKT
ncbi:MAG: hypothetical protein M3247_07130 [Thermoproteota archaeon]|nr:hypothetical protein [Thermoproteota archaeon]